MACVKFFPVNCDTSIQLVEWYGMWIHCTSFKGSWRCVS